MHHLTNVAFVCLNNGTVYCAMRGDEEGRHGGDSRTLLQQGGEWLTTSSDCGGNALGARRLQKKEATAPGGDGCQLAWRLQDRQ